MLISEYFSSQSAQSTSSTKTIVSSLTVDELNAMRYVCALLTLKKYETKQGDVYSQYVQCLAVEGEGDDILTYTRK